MVSSVTAAAIETQYDFVVVTMKALPDIYSLPDIIRPVVTRGVTSIVLIQNGLDIEMPIVEAFPSCAVMSGVSMIGSRVTDGHLVYHEDPDEVKFGPYYHNGLPTDVQLSRAQLFVDIYRAGGADAALVEDVVAARWRKLLWNGTFNTLCTLTRMSVGSLQVGGGKETLLIPAMKEMEAVAKAAGYAFPENAVNETADGTPPTSAFRPSMLVDLEKGNPLELEVILGAPLRYAQKFKVNTPVLGIVYDLLKVVQWQILEKRNSKV